MDTIIIMANNYGYNECNQTKSATDYVIHVLNCAIPVLTTNELRVRLLIN